MKTRHLLTLVLTLLFFVIQPGLVLARSGFDRARYEKFLGELIFESFAYYYSHADTSEKYLRVFGQDLSDNEKKSLDEDLKKEPRPKVTYLGEGRLQFELGTEKVIVRPINLFANQYDVNKIKWVFNPKDPIELQTNLLYKKLLNQRNPKTSLYHLLIPRAEAHPALMAIARAIVVAGRFAAPHVAKAAGHLLEKGAHVAGKAIEVSAIGLITGAVFVSRQEAVPFERALYCAFWGLTGHVCEKEQVKAKLGEPSETISSMMIAFNSCPSKQIPEFVVTVIDEKNRKKIARIMKFDINGKVTEVQEYHAHAQEPYGDPLKATYVVDPSKAKIYLFEDGKLSKVRHMKFKPSAYTQEFLLENTRGPINGKRSVIVDARIKGDEALLNAVNMRNAWINSMRDHENDETFIDRTAEKSDDPKVRENWQQHSAVVTKLDKLMNGACDPVFQKEIEPPQSPAPSVN